MKRLLKIYRFILICLLITIVLISAFSCYSVSIIDKNNTIRQIDINMKLATTYLDQNVESTNLILDELIEDCKAKTRTASLLLSDKAVDEKALEEIRVAVNADIVSISDTKGNIIDSTDLSSAGNKVHDIFLEHISQSVFTEAVSTEINEVPVIISASTLSNHNGLLQIVYSSDVISHISKELNFTSFAEDMQLYDYGITALIDKETGNYISHTDSSEIGKICPLNNKFTKSKGRFDLEYNEQKCMARYQVYEDYIIAVVVPYENIHVTCYIVFKWVIASGICFLIVLILSMRMGYIHMKRAEQNSDSEPVMQENKLEEKETVTLR